jgi:integrase
VQKRKNWSLSPEERMDAREALQLLAGSGLSLESAVRLALGRQGGTIQSVPLGDGVAAFLRERKDRLRSKTMDFYERQLFPFCEAMGDQSMDRVTKSKVEAHLRTLTPFMAAARFRSVRALWRWALRRSTPFVREDVTAGLAFRQPGRKGDVEFLSVNQAIAILEGCEEHRHALALMLFAGIRPEEIRGENKPPLDWDCINCDGRIVRIPGSVAKTRQPRILERLPDNLWAWLADGPKEGPVCAINIRSLVVHAQRAADFRAGNGKVLERWPHDAMRHSFATYHVALFADPGRTALLLGHEGAPTMLYRHYRGLATQAQGEAYFAIRP